MAKIKLTVKLTREEEEHRPQVLLIGNGLDMMFNAPSWGMLIRSIAKNLGMEGFTNINELSAPLQYEALSQFRRGNGKEDLLRELNETETALEHCIEDEAYSAKKDFVRRILTLDFDAIVTTNYTHLLENLCRRSSRVPEKETTHVVCKRLTTREGATRLLYHLHGDIDEPSSIVLGHQEYAECLTELKDNRGNGTLTDLILNSDIYTLGHSLSSDEIDLWWLFEEKKNYGNGRLYHYTENYYISKNASEKYRTEQKSNSAIRWLVTVMGGNNESLHFSKKYRKEDGKVLTLTENDKKVPKDYIDFYRAIIDDIETKINVARAERS